jgi:chromosome partitioning protein
MTLRRIAIANQKGGSGKTTMAVNLAAALGENGRRVLLVDLDPQAHASLFFGLKESAETAAGILDALKEEPESVTALTVNTGVTGVDLVPASRWLHAAEKVLAWRKVGRETLLRGALDALPRGTYDYVLMDCAPNLEILTLNALGAADEVLIPVEASALALDGLKELRGTIDEVRQIFNPALRISGVAMVRADRTRITQDIRRTLEASFGSTVFRTAVRENVRVREAPSFCMPLTLYAPASAACEDFRQLAREVIAQETLRTRARQ